MKRSTYYAARREEPAGEPHVALVGPVPSRHASWDDAVQHVAASTVIPRERLWFRVDRPGEVDVYDGRASGWQEPVACVYDPGQYQRACSRGDLEDVPQDFPSRTGERSSDPAPTTAQTAMKETQPETPVYIVLEKASPHVMWRNKVCPVGVLVQPVTRNKADEKKLARYVSAGFFRVATEDERKAAAAEILVDKEAASAAAATTATPPVPAMLTVGTAAAVQVQNVALDRIKPDPTQPRKDFSEGSMRELVDSIKQVGIEQAILVRPMSRWRQIVSFARRQWQRWEAGDKQVGLSLTDFWEAGIKISLSEVEESEAVDRLVREKRVVLHSNGPREFRPVAGALEPLTGNATLPGEDEWLEIVYGERRWRAAQVAGLTEIPAKVRDLSDVEAAELQAVENLDRADLNPMEEAAQYQKLLCQPGYTMARLVEVTGRAKNTIHGKLKLLAVPDEVRLAVIAGTLPAVTAERIGRLEGRVQTEAIKAILHAHPDDLDGGKVPSDRKCQAIIEACQQEEAARVALEAKKAEYGKRGVGWLNGKERDRVMGHWWPKPESGLVMLAEMIDGDPEGRNYNAVLAKKPGKAAAKVIRPMWATQRDDGQIVELYGKLDVLQALKDAGVEFKLRPRSSPGKSEDAKRRAKDKLMKGVLNQAAAAISTRAFNYFCPRQAQTPEAERMWQAMARSAVYLASNDDLRAYVKRHGVSLVMQSSQYYVKPTPDFRRTMLQFLEGKRFSDLASITAELMLTAGAWSSHSSDFYRPFLAGAGEFGVNLQQLKQEAGWTAEDEKEARRVARHFGDDGDYDEGGSASARTNEEPAEAEAA